MPIRDIPQFLSAHPAIVGYALLIALHGIVLLALAVGAFRARRRRRRAERLLRAEVGRCSRGEALRLADAIGAVIAGLPETSRIPLPQGDWAQARRHAVAWLDRALERRLLSRSRRDVLRVIGCLAIVAQRSEEDDLRTLTTLLFASPPPEAATFAAYAMGRAAASWPGAAVVLASILRDCNGAAATTSVWALRKVLEANREQIAMVAADPSPRVRRVAIAAAGEVARGARDRGDHAAALLQVICTALEDADAHVRAEACRALAAETRSAGALLARLDDDSDEVRRAAALALLSGGAGDAIVAIARSLTRCRPQTLRDMLNALAGQETPVPRELLQWVGRGGMATSVALACISAVNADRSAIAALVDLTADASAAIPLRRAAARALALLARHPGSPARDTAVLERLVSVLASETDDEVLASVVDALAVCGGASEAAALVGRIESAGRFVREKIVEALALNEFVSRSRSPMLLARGSGSTQ